MILSRQFIQILMGEGRDRGIWVSFDDKGDFMAMTFRSHKG